MKITKLTVYGFGKHENLTIDLETGAAVVYGPNEAGKTTVQQFIIQTLFGYPARNQPGRRYEPKTGGKFGGQVHVEDSEFGNVVIERVGGKSKGEVTLFFEDGRLGGEEELQQLLRNYDRASYEAIFAFSVHELQHLEKMTEEELSRTLLASGTTGMDTVASLEGKLQKEMGALFKKSGRNPEINQLIEELHSIETELKEHRSRSELYAPAVAKIHEIGIRLNEMDEQERELGTALKQAEKWQQAAPLFERAAVLEEEMARMKVQTFPADGSRQMDRLQDRLAETSAKLKFLEEERGKLEDKGSVLEEDEALRQLAGRETEWQQLKLNERQQRDEAARLEDEKTGLLGLLGVGEAAALQADVSLPQEERLAEIVRRAEEEEEAERYALRRLEEEKQKLKDTEQELRIFLQSEPSEQERRTAEEWPELSAKLAQAKAERKSQKQGGITPLAMSLLLVGAIGAVYGLLQPQWVIFALGTLFALAGTGLVFRPKAGGTDRSSEELDRYGGKTAEYEAVHEKVTRFDGQLDRLMEAADAAKRQVVRASESRPDSSARRACAEFFTELGFPEDAGRSTAVELFRKLRDLQALDAKWRRVQTEQARLQAELTAWQEQAEGAVGKPVSRDNLLYEVKTRLSEVDQRNEETRKRMERLHELGREIEEYQALSHRLTADQNEWFAQAGAADKAGFYELADEWERRVEIGKELAPVSRQLAAIGEAAPPEGWSDDFIPSCERRLAALKEERHHLLEEKAEQQQFVSHLLTDEAYEEKLQQFEEKKASLSVLAKRWSAYQALSLAIRQMMDELKEHKLPLVMDSARQFFAALTEGVYTGLEMDESGTFEALRQDGLRFRIGELSQATKEQAYIALRLALADSLKDSHPFPVMMDDAFVHFDRSRRTQMINLLTELQKNHQFIYFTCHDSIQRDWTDAQRIDIATIGRSVYQ